MKALTVGDRAELVSVLAFAQGYLEAFATRDDCPEERRKTIANIAVTLENAAAKLRGKQ